MKHYLTTTCLLLTLTACTKKPSVNYVSEGTPELDSPLHNCYKMPKDKNSRLEDVDSSKNEELGLAIVTAAAIVNTESSYDDCGKRMKNQKPKIDKFIQDRVTK